MAIPRVNSLRQRREQSARLNNTGAARRPMIVRDAPKRIDFIIPSAAPTEPAKKTTPPWLRKNPPPPKTNSTPEIPTMTAPTQKPDLKGYAQEVKSIRPTPKVVAVGLGDTREGITERIKALDQSITIGQGATLSPFIEQGEYRLNPPPQWGGGPS